MAKAVSGVELIPSARRLINSLRDVGYDFKHAVADLVDNSIAANATEIGVDFEFCGEDSWVRITDNGRGMPASFINEAMRFGSERDYDTDDLGKFGLGLKTASLSQCRRFTVASRVDATAKRIETRRWDLDHVEKTNRWEVLDVSAADRSLGLVGPLAKHTGTVVLWEQLDRVLGYRVPWGDRARNGLFNAMDELQDHLAMVFHRFLMGEVPRRPKLTMLVNGNLVPPWDPFARDERATIDYATQQFEVHTDQGRGLVGYHAFILPPQHKFSSLRRFEYYSGPTKWNNQQGLYIYRGNRMIQSGGWSWMRTSDEHTKLARVAIDFHTDLDAAFALNISKARVTLPSNLRDQLRPHVEMLVKEARKKYEPDAPPRPPEAPPVVQFAPSPAMPQTPVNSPATSSPRPALQPNEKPSTAMSATKTEAVGIRGIHPIAEAMQRAATAAGLSSELEQIRAAVKTHEPGAAHELGW